MQSGTFPSFELVDFGSSPHVSRYPRLPLAVIREKTAPRMATDRGIRQPQYYGKQMNFSGLSVDESETP